MKLIRNFAMIGLMLGTLTSAHASLIPVSPVPFTGTGLGTVDTVLGGGNAGGNEITGISHTQMRTIAQSGASSATDLRVISNVSELTGNPIEAFQGTGVPATASKATGVLETFFVGSASGTSGGGIGSLVPEPSTYLMLAGGLLGFAFYARRYRLSLFRC